MRKQCIIIVTCGLARCTIGHILFHKRHDLKMKKTLSYIKCLFGISLQSLSETFLILRRTEQDMIKQYVGLHVKCPLFFSDFNETLIFSVYFRKNTQKPHSIKIRTVVSMRTDMTKLTVAFRNFAKAVKNHRLFCHHQRTTVTLFATQ